MLGPCIYPLSRVIYADKQGAVFYVPRMTELVFLISKKKNVVLYSQYLLL